MAEVRTTSKPVRKPNNVFGIPTSVDTDFFKWWCRFLRPFVPLTKRELDVVACLLKKRYDLSKEIHDPKIVDTMLMSESVRDEIISECNITVSYFYVLMSNLRKKGLMHKNSFDCKLVPNFREDDNGCFHLLILFKDKNVC